MNQREKQKNDGILAIVFVLLLLATAGTNYNKTGQMQYLIGELICLILLLITIINYLRIKRAIKKSKQRTQKKKNKVQYNNQFVKRAAIINKKYNHKEAPPSLTSGHIQSMWDEINKI